MIVERVLGNVTTMPANSPTQETDAIELQWFEGPRRSMRKRSRGQRDVALLMPPGQILRHGDILFDDPNVRLVVEIVPCEVLVLRPRSAAEFGIIAFELGNLHVPAEFNQEQIRVAPDGPIFEVIERLGVPGELKPCRFQPIFAAGGVTLSPNLQISRRERVRSPIAGLRVGDDG